MLTIFIGFYFPFCLWTGTHPGGFFWAALQSRTYLGMSTLRDLIFKRPSRQFEYLHVLLDLSSHEKDKVRQQALLFIKRMYEKDHLREYVEKFALNYLQLLVHPNPPSVAAPWTEETIKHCLYLYLALLPQNHKLIHELASVYTEAIADIKRTILRVIEQPIRGMGMNSQELLKLVKNCPKGAETLVTRCLHSLTDKVPPSPELVKRKEVIQALPKLIKLNPIVVKEVFNRLLGTQHGEGNSTVSPLNPGELLIALHNIDSTKCDMKSIIKATNLCFAEHNVYTSEVLAVVMQQLMEQNPLPMLLMRTVIQSLTMYPRLGGFVMNILSRLILKQSCQLTPCPSCPQQAHVPNSTMAILEATIKQETEGKEIQPLEEGRGPAPSRTKTLRREREWILKPDLLDPQDDTEPQPLLPRVSQDMIALRLAQEKALKRQLEELLSKEGAGSGSSSDEGSSSKAPAPAQPTPVPEEPAKDSQAAEAGSASPLKEPPAAPSKPGTEEEEKLES
ncbi:hypothetical protein E2320_000849 [Naja naja]|nr:hypothetical protein E2320_000849 [Naja naja]